MSNIEYYQRDGRRLSLDRKLHRELDRIDGHTQLGVARIETLAELQAVKADAVVYVGRRAMQDVAMLTQLEQQLTQAVPLAAGRLQGIGDMAALGAADIVGDTIRRLHRC